MRGNEKGISLIELLATITIAGIVMIVALTLLTSSTMEFNDTSQNFRDNQNSGAALKTLEKYISGSSNFYAAPSGREWRFKYFDSTRPFTSPDTTRNRVLVLYYDNIQTLSIYDIGSVSEFPTWSSTSTPLNLTFPGSYRAIKVSDLISNSSPPQISYNSTTKLLTGMITFRYSIVNLNASGQISDQAFNFKYKLLNY